VLLTLAVTGCGSSSSLGANASPAASTPVSGAAPAPPGAAPVENNPPGDIPDNVAYVAYRNAAGHYGFSHPEGWARTEHGVAVTFTDKLNGISATSVPASTAPTVSSAKATDVPKLASSQGAFQLISVTPAQLPAGQGVLIVYRRNSAPDPVTGKVFRDEVQRYEIFGAGHLVDLEMYGAVGSDNVDPFRKISQSLTLA
jgi:hypothetical protein